ncbi:AGE family epimerase/isomerase [Bradyrhizobium sp. CCBAU 51753]|uniref:AGE family epimerase/isomerase n=1 Tax=Bradyrhizobium sp. CCBAU 51753 TaxID=1325100 RepID=UPI00188B626C|nr:AGE family epimerase/isomerase [Bradyrhizobium sp. CCBAU 51753]QOZ26668.1 AGE family epimerase/isomerase [Bradyrhizobium sp. CCBAU 51753]
MEGQSSSTRAADSAGFAAARQMHERLKAWLLNEAIPLWTTIGLDAAGIFSEAISQGGHPVVAARRAGVPARQIYALLTAHRLGARIDVEQVLRGADRYVVDFQRADGLFRSLLSHDGIVLSDGAALYDQAFAMLAGAAVARHSRQRAKRVAHRVRDCLIRTCRHRAGGFVESDRPTTQRYSSPHKHLLEACLTWVELGDSGTWQQLADDVVELAIARFIGRGGALYECFNVDWSAQSGIAGRIVEPGHQFEWSRLLAAWANLTRNDSVYLVADRLQKIGETHGIARPRSVVVDAILDDFTVLEDTARLWSQTERLKAAVARAEREGDAWWAIAAEAGETLERFLQTPIKGLWWDRMSADGEFTGAATAGSLYHLVSAIDTLDQAIYRRVAPQVSESPEFAAIESGAGGSASTGAGEG